MRPFGPEPATRERSTPSSRANLRTEGEAWAFLNASASMAGGAGAADAAGASRGAGVGAAGLAAGAEAAGSLAGGGAAAAAAAAAADSPLPLPGAVAVAEAPLPSPPAVASRTRMILPWLTLSPTLTLRSFTVPAVGEGTSIVALSDSSAMRGSSAFTASPGLTKTWTMGTSVKSPISGTLISRVLMAVSRVRWSKAPDGSRRRRISGWPHRPSRRGARPRPRGL